MIPSLPLVSLIAPPSATPAALRRQLLALHAPGLARLEVLGAAPAAEAADGPWAWRRVAPSGPHPADVNAALDACRGDYAVLLAADGEYAPGGLDALLRAATAAPDAAVLWYAASRVLLPAPGGEVRFGRAFNPALFAHDRLFHLGASLIHRRAIDAGCRIDARLGDVADHDFLQQVAAQGRCVFVADAPAPLRLPAPQPAGSAAARLDAACLRRARWTGTRLYHTLRSSLLCQRAGERLQAGDLAQAREDFRAILDDYPDDPDALHGLARCALAGDAPDTALPLLHRALELDPDNAALRHTHARAQARLAPAATPAWGEPAQASAALRVAAPGQPARAAACACGSGRRYKHCCGRLEASPEDAAARAAAATLGRARALARRAEGEAARRQLAALPPPHALTPALAREAGELLLDLHALEPARAMLASALDRAPQDDRARAACEHAAGLALRPIAWASAAATVRDRLAALAARAAGPARPPCADLHVVVPLHRLGGSERRALNLCRSLAAQARVTLWSTTPPLAAHRAEHAVRVIDGNHHPDGGAVLLVGTYYECAEWLERAPLQRVVICHNLGEQYAGLIERLVQLERNPHRPTVTLCFPSRLFRRACGLHGFVDYSPVDLDRFHPAPGPRRDGPLRVGRHARAYALKFHPDDGAFVRAVQQRGHAVHLLGGSVLAGAFDAGEPAPTLLDEGAAAPADFLRDLDVFVYRKHPAFFETGGSAVLEAMACALPIIAFAADCGAAELIAHGRNGFLVDSADEALDCLDRLAADPALRARLGAAARADLAAIQAAAAHRRATWYLAGDETD